MSAGFSPSGVASLRAKFEVKDQSTSPPSRGRSPAASLSVSGDASRPISTVRTNFVAVEPSGQMGQLKASEESGNKGDVVNSNRVEESTKDRAMEKPKINGIELTPQKSVKENNSTSPSEQTTAKDSPQKKLGIVNSVSSEANPEKPVSTAQDDTATIVPSAPKEVAAVYDGAAPDEEISALGSILKGSPFEQDGNTGETLNARQIEAAAEPELSSEEQAESPSTPMTNGKSKEAPAKKAGLQSRIKIASRPSAIGKKSAAQPASATTDKSGNEPETSAVRAPITPKNEATPSKHSLSEKKLPRSATSKPPKKEVFKDARKTSAERPSRPSVAPTVPAPASKPAPKPAKRPRPTSPPLLTKPRPKSPTRAIRLPGSATAPTAASAAKTDVVPAGTAKTRDRIPMNPASLRLKPARTSLPDGSKPADKGKDKTKSRLSTASSKAPEGSFLDRMMRPTQSSSQKTHEKVEAKTPPKKANGIRPKRRSDGSEKGKGENVETMGEQPAESAPSPPVKGPADPSEAPSTNDAKKGIDEAAPGSAGLLLSQ